jgi:dienelactone hydrolase
VQKNLHYHNLKTIMRRTQHSIIALITYTFFAVFMANQSHAATNPILAKKIEPDSIFIEYDRFYRNRPIKAGGFLMLPNNHGDSIFPLMIIMHGSHGASEHEYDYAKELNAMGVAAFIIDSYTPRGITSTENNQRQVPIGNMVDDIFMALQTLAVQPHIDKDNIGLMGFSKGGAATLMTAINMNKHMAKRKDPVSFKVYVAFYPGCVIHPYDMHTNGADIYMLLGEKDTYTGTTGCKKVADELTQAGGNVHVMSFKDAGHAWDYDFLYFFPQAEVYKNCTFREQANGQWLEETSKTTNIIGLQGKNYQQALNSCRTYGAYVEGNKAATAAGFEALKNAVQKHLLGNTTH